MDNVSTLSSRPQLYYNIDGVGELVIGLTILAFSLLIWFQMHTPKSSAWNQMYTLFLFIGIISLILHYGSKAIKNRITYRRTGYVEYRTRRCWATIAVAAGVAGLASAGMFLAARSHFVLSASVPILFLLFAVLYIRAIRPDGWKWAVFAAMVVSTVLIAFLPADLLENVADHSSFGAMLTPRTLGAYWLTWTVFGALYVVSGAITFWLYLRHTEPAAKENE